MNQFKRQKRPVSGWLNLWKPVGMSSMQAVAKARHLYGASKAGHAGTLDPLADGILPIAFGEATKLIPLLHEAGKAYRFGVNWGVATNTDDTEGETVATSPARPSEAAILAALPALTGVISQIPPAFSAIKIDGERAYTRARAGEEVEMPSRTVTIDRFELIEIVDENMAVFEVACGTGTYVRALARDLAKSLSTVAHCSFITRIHVGPFRQNESISLDSLENLAYTDRDATLWPLVLGLDDIPALGLTDMEAQRLHSGQAIRFLARMDEARLAALPPNGPILAMHHDRIVAICRLDGVTLHPERVLNL